MKKLITGICLFAFLLNPILSKSQSDRKKLNNKIPAPSVTDKNYKKDISDSPLYLSQHEVKIGDQTWLDVNLNVDHFKNGEPILQAKSNQEWYNAIMNKQPAWCYFDNKISNGKIYGKLYNWYAVSDKRGLAPDGWHIPSHDEWTVLSEYLGGNNISGNKLKSNKGWTVKPGTNESGFSALPGAGMKNCFKGQQKDCYFNWQEIGGKDDETARFWSSTPENVAAGVSWCVFLTAAYYREPDKLHFAYFENGEGLSVRCVKDK